MCRLRFFQIDLDLSDSEDTMYDLDVLAFLMRSLHISLTSPATLEHLKLNICFPRGADYECERFYNNLRSAKIWSILTLITTHPTGLQVDIDIDYINGGSDLHKVLDAVHYNSALLHATTQLLRVRCTCRDSGSSSM